MKEVNLNMTTKIYALVAGDDEEEIMFAVSTDTDTLKDMLEQNVGEYRIKEIGLWVLSDNSYRFTSDGQIVDTTKKWFVRFNDVETWRLHDKLFCYTWAGKNIKNVLLRVGHQADENSNEYIEYLNNVRCHYHIYERVHLDTFYPDGMMNA